MKGRRYEPRQRQTLQGRGDYRDTSGGREQRPGRRTAAQARHSRRDLIPMEVPVLRDGGIAIKAAQEAAERERSA